MHHTRGVLIRNFGRLQDPGLDALRLEIDSTCSGQVLGVSAGTGWLGPT